MGLYYALLGNSFRSLLAEGTSLKRKRKTRAHTHVKT